MIANKPPITGIQNGTSGGRFNANNKPVSAALGLFVLLFGGHGFDMTYLAEQLCGGGLMVLTGYRR